MYLFMQTFCTKKTPKTKNKRKQTNYNTRFGKRDVQFGFFPRRHSPFGFFVVSFLIFFYICFCFELEFHLPRQTKYSIGF